MNETQAIKLIERHIEAHRIGEYPHIFIGEALQMAISALQAQEKQRAELENDLLTLEEPANAE